MSDSLQPQELQHSRLPCPSVSPRICSDSCPLIQWCHPTISSSVTPFSCCPQCFPASGSFLMNWLFTSSGRSIGASTSASVLPNENSQWIFRTYFFNDGRVGSPCSPRDAQESSPTTQFKSINSLVLCFLYGTTLTSITWPLEKP